MKRIRNAWLILMAISLMGCSAHSPFIVKNTTDVTQLSSTKYAPHNNRIFVTSASLPETAKYELVAQLEVGKVWYGSSEDVLESLADSARHLGADAVVEVKTWHQPAGWSWSAPHGSGKAVKILEPASVDFANLGGNWK